MRNHNIDFKKSFRNQNPSVINNTIIEVVIFYSKLIFVNRFKNNFLDSTILGASPISVSLSETLSRPNENMTRKRHRVQTKKYAWDKWYIQWGLLQRLKTATQKRDLYKCLCVNFIKNRYKILGSSPFAGIMESGVRPESNISRSHFVI